MQDVRKSERAPCFIKAKIGLDQTVIDCLIRDLSPMGAKIALGGEVALPSAFDLTIPLKAKTFRAILKWRDADFAGVGFE